RATEALAHALYSGRGVSGGGLARVRAVLLEGPRQAVLREVPPPRLGPGDVLVEIERAGICGSDISVFRGSRPTAFPLLMGHEAVGRVVDAASMRQRSGVRVAIEPNIPCGTCDVCRR